MRPGRIVSLDDICRLARQYEAPAITMAGVLTIQANQFRDLRNAVCQSLLIVSRERLFDIISAIITAIFTVVLALSTVLLWKETKDLRNFAKRQGEDMKASIAEASRAATAMRDVADGIIASAKVADENLAIFKHANVRQMRACLTVGLRAVAAINSSLAVGS
jgi:hypothetical protein